MRTVSKPVRPVVTAALLAFGVAASGCAEVTTNAVPRTASASSKQLAPKYAPVLPSVLARALPVDPRKGYLVKEVKPGVFVITDGVYQSVFFTTGSGVLLVDAPQSLAAHIPQAVAEVTKEPIRQVIYSHAHLDHIAGTELLLKANPNLAIIAEQGVSDFLKEKRDHRRPIPTTTFVGSRTLVVGSTKLELRRGGWHSDEGDLFIYAPDKKFLIAIDTIAAGYVPFMDLDLTSNVQRYMKVFDQLLAYDFDVLVPGHLTGLATRDDVMVSRDYTMDVYKTVKRIHDGTDQMKVMSSAAETYTWDNKFALFRVLLDGVIDQCDREIQSRWKDKLASVDIWGASHCRAMLIYARWDD